MTADQHDIDDAAGLPVFVSDDDQRAGYFRWIGRALALVACAYVVITVGSLVGAPWVPRITLPGAGALAPNRPAALPSSLGPTASPLATPHLDITSSKTRTTTPVGASGASTTTTARNGARTQSQAPSTTTVRQSNHGVPNQPTTTSGSPGTGSTPGHSGQAPGHTTTTTRHHR